MKEMFLHKADFWNCFSFSLLIRLLAKNLWFLPATKTTRTSNNYNNFLSFRVYFFIYILIYHFSTASNVNTPGLCHLITKILSIQQEHLVEIQ